MKRMNTFSCEYLVFLKVPLCKKTIMPATDLLSISTNLQKAVAWLDEIMQQHPEKQRSKVLAEAELRFDLAPAECEFLNRHFCQADKDQL